jgi:hypothetical protein
VAAELKAEPLQALSPATLRLPRGPLVLLGFALDALEEAEENMRNGRYGETMESLSEAMGLLETVARIVEPLAARKS